MDNLIKIQDALNLRQPLFVDLRSPLEYAQAHIPGARNLPLLEDEERATIGTVYKNDSPQHAVERGLSLVAPKLPAIYSLLKEWGAEREIVLYCWRGGMRSNSISQILSVLGLSHYRLAGGFKAFRQLVLEELARPVTKEIIVLHGLTGVGKTEILQRIRSEGGPALDLEGLASHRGSVFGHVGLDKQPSQKHFEGLLFWEMRRLGKFDRLMVECESKRIGNIHLPPAFFQAMESGRRILIYDSPANRVKRLIATYINKESAVNVEHLQLALSHLKKGLGNAMVERLTEALADRDFETVAYELLECYYDPLYSYPAGPAEGYDMCLDAGNLEACVAQLKSLLTVTNGGKEG